MISLRLFHLSADYAEAICLKSHFPAHFIYFSLSAQDERMRLYFPQFYSHKLSLMQWRMTLYTELSRRIWSTMITCQWFNSFHWIKSNFYEMLSIRRFDSTKREMRLNAELAFGCDQTPRQYRRGRERVRMWRYPAHIWRYLDFHIQFNSEILHLCISLFNDDSRWITQNHWCSLSQQSISMDAEALLSTPSIRNKKKKAQWKYYSRSFQRSFSSWKMAKMLV